LGKDFQSKGTKTEVLQRGGIKMNHCIEVEEINKRYPNGYMALNGISFKIKERDVVGYLGSNGAGKTTTIKILTDLIKPTTGHAYVKGINVNRNPKEALRHIGALIEVPGTYNYLTPKEMLSYFGKVYGMKRERINSRIKDILKLVNLGDWENKKIGAFSTGMQRRLSIAKAILHEPEIVILDEPVLGLDPKGIKDVRELIKWFHSEGMTVLLSSHLLHEVSETCNNVIFLEKGKIIRYDSVENISSIMKNKTIDVKFLAPLTDKRIKIIGSVEGVDCIEMINGYIRLHFDGKPKTSAKILMNLINSGLEVVSYIPRSMGLEDYYVSIINDEKEAC
jgi:ABC-2 type transport system ATP-binding protein